MKTIKLTESTLKRIVERIIKEEEKDTDNKNLMKMMMQLQKDPDNQELKDKIATLTQKLGLPLTQKGKKELNQ
jgi:NADH:ubiquinone oxidoreductase subunit E